MKKLLHILYTILLFTTGIFAQNNALDFDGVDDYVEVANFPNYGTTFTQSVWIYPTDATDTYRAIIGNNTASVGPRAPFIYQIGLNIHYGFGDGGSLQYATLTNSNPLTINQWNHIEVTFDANDSYKLYVNGIHIDSFEGADGRTPTATGTFTIGKIDNYFKGKLEEVRIWSVVRTQAEIQTSMHTELTGSESNLVAYYKMNESSGASLTDSSSNSHTGTLINMDSSTDWVLSFTVGLNRYGQNTTTSAHHVNKNGELGSGDILTAYGEALETPLQNSLHLNAASSQYLSFSKPSSLNATGDYTFETWIKFNTIQNNGVMDPIFGGGQADYLSVYGGQFATRINVNNPCGGDRNFFSSSNFTTETWHHIAVVRVGSTVTAYLDGVATGSTTSCTGIFLNSLSTVHIGKNTWRSGYLDAYISNMRYVVGTAVYTGNFTPPTAVLTAISGTEFLLLANDVNAPLTDSSANAITVTSYNNPTVIQGNGPF